MIESIIVVHSRQAGESQHYGIKATMQGGEVNRKTKPRRMGFGPDRDRAFRSRIARRNQLIAGTPAGLGVPFATGCGRDVTDNPSRLCLFVFTPPSRLSTILHKSPPSR
jgi:hypothetical protein